MEEIRRTREDVRERKIQPKDSPRNYNKKGDGSFNLEINGRKDIKYSAENMEVKSAKGKIEARQLKDSSDLQIEIGDDKLLNITYKGKSVEVHGPNVDFVMEEIDGSRRRVTANSDSRGFHKETIEIEGDNRKASLGELDLEDDKGVLKISIKPNDLTEGEEENIIFIGYGKNRDIIYKYGDIYKPIGCDIDTSGEDNSREKTSKENKETIKKALKEKWGSMYGAIEGLVNIMEVYGEVAPAA